VFGPGDMRTAHSDPRMCLYCRINSRGSSGDRHDAGTFRLLEIPARNHASSRFIHIAPLNGKPSPSVRSPISLAHHPFRFNIALHDSADYDDEELHVVAPAEYLGAGPSIGFLTALDALLWFWANSPAPGRVDSVCQGTSMLAFIGGLIRPYRPKLVLIFIAHAA